MNNHQKATIAILAALFLAIPGQFGRVKDWLDVQPPIKQLSIGVVFALVVSLAVASITEPLFLDLEKYIL